MTKEVDEPVDSSEFANYVLRNPSKFGYPVIRLAESYLNEIEAVKPDDSDKTKEQLEQLYETLKKGVFSDAEYKEAISKIMNRKMQ